MVSNIEIEIDAKLLKRLERRAKKEGTTPDKIVEGILGQFIIEQRELDARPPKCRRCGVSKVCGPGSTIMQICTGRASP